MNRSGGAELREIAIRHNSRSTKSSIPDLKRKESEKWLKNSAYLLYLKRRSGWEPAFLKNSCNCLRPPDRASV